MIFRLYQITLELETLLEEEQSYGDEPANC